MAEQQQKTPSENLKPKYEIVGLIDAEIMPVHFQGEEWDLKKLTDEQAQALIASKYPHIRAKQ